MEVDETFFGTRKYGVGRKARARGHWMVTVTEDLGAAGTGRSAWDLVKTRDRAALETIIKSHLLTCRSTVITDAWKGYVQVNKVCRHKVVNHSCGFKDADTGARTNGAECLHGLIKRQLLLQHHGYGKTSRQLRKTWHLLWRSTAKADGRTCPSPKDGDIASGVC